MLLKIRPINHFNQILQFVSCNIHYQKLFISNKFSKIAKQFFWGFFQGKNL